MSITGCCFSPSAKVLITSSVDSEGMNSSCFNLLLIDTESNTLLYRLFLDPDIIFYF